MIPKIAISNFNYNLPENKIARFPLEERDQSKLLIFKKDSILEDCFSHISNYLDSGSLLIFNNTKVIYARLLFYKKTGACIELFCLEPVTPHTFEQILSTKNTCTWLCTVGNLKKWKNEDLQLNYGTGVLSATKLDLTNNLTKVKFTWEENITFGELLEQCGAIPIPPYLKRNSEDIDKLRYQTIYSKHKGSVAAPTAGLHFSNKIFDDLNSKNITFEEVTLHVGAGTFKPVKSDYISEHTMHTEYFTVQLSSLKNIISKLDTIIAVGTTTVRVLESLYWLGLKINDTNNTHIDQWEPYNNNCQKATKDVLIDIVNYMEKKNIKDLNASTQIMLVPPYKFRIVKGLITNFHQPQSTLLLLVAALIGNNWKKVYDYALKNNFRFLSYGDSSLLLP